MSVNCKVETRLVERMIQVEEKVAVIELDGEHVFHLNNLLFDEQERIQGGCEYKRCLADIYRVLPDTYEKQLRWENNEKSRTDK